MNRTKTIEFLKKRIQEEIAQISLELKRRENEYQMAIHLLEARRTQFLQLRHSFNEALKRSEWQDVPFLEQSQIVIKKELTDLYHLVQQKKQHLEEIQNKWRLKKQEEKQFNRIQSKIQMEKTAQDKKKETLTLNDWGIFQWQKKS